MGFRLEFETDNAAFEDGNGEAVRLLLQVAARVQAGETEGLVRDINGNLVGAWRFADDVKIRRRK